MLSDTSLSIKGSQFEYRKKHVHCLNFSKRNVNNFDLKERIHTTILKDPINIWRVMKEFS